ncbi:hypothetical protein H710_00974 [Bartonella bacilliformis Ver097]|uniref:tRNA dimethylallyltransferase n=1 Tax=Bartonella bacilliformis Ver097 TaxID=1293911 RepID=A0A072R0F6_BARBA|nr:hypothetical protein H710_00974 [Bartonella bacilliformis Ver097]
MIAQDCLERILLLPPRQLLYERINERFTHMVEKGALEEVELMKQLTISPLSPAMKAIGVLEFTDYLNGCRNFENAIEVAKTRTRQYAKRQMTWFRHQLDEEWKIIS